MATPQKICIYVPCTFHMFHCSPKLPKLVTNESVRQIIIPRKFSQKRWRSGRGRLMNAKYWDPRCLLVSWTLCSGAVAGRAIKCIAPQSPSSSSILALHCRPSHYPCFALNCIALLYFDASSSTPISITTDTTQPNHTDWQHMCVGLNPV